MTKQPSNLTAAAIITYLVLVISILSLIIGFGYVVFSLFLLITETGSVALNHFLTGMCLMAFGYLLNILFAYLITRTWSWRLSSSFNLQSTTKK